MKLPARLPHALFILLMGACLLPQMSAPLALLLGFLFSCCFRHPFAGYTHKLTGLLLKLSVIGLGFGMQLDHALTAGRQGFALTVFSILSIFLLGLALGAFFKINRRTTHLVSSGTAICGGSAIAAVAPVIGATEKDLSVALATVFALNAIALLLFPVIGHALHLSQYQFGLWSAIAIQDTSSVVGAAASYGRQALAVATVVKLARALWIIPVALISGPLFKSPGQKIRLPWFIGLFLVAMLLNSYAPLPATWTMGITHGAKAMLVLTLFLIGSGLSIDQIRAAGWRPLALAFLLWVFISAASLCVIVRL